MILPRAATRPPVARFLGFCVLLLAAVLGGAPPAARAQDPSEGAKTFLPHTPTSWLVIAPVDFRARRPFNPDVIFSRRMLDPDSAAPRAGAKVSGERGETETWTGQEGDGARRV